VAQDSWKIMRKVGELISSGGGAGLVVDYGGDRVFGSSFRVSEYAVDRHHLGLM
jgi:NADH dehydrogenase [ubiquinone] 1 alpha subcomplex assembly factor 7